MCHCIKMTLREGFSSTCLEVQFAPDMLQFEPSRGVSPTGSQGLRLRPGLATSAYAK